MQWNWIISDVVISMFWHRLNYFTCHNLGNVPHVYRFPIWKHLRTVVSETSENSPETFQSCLLFTRGSCILKEDSGCLWFQYVNNIQLYTYMLYVHPCLGTTTYFPFDLRFVCFSCHLTTIISCNHPWNEVNTTVGIVGDVWVNLVPQNLSRCSVFWIQVGGAIGRFSWRMWFGRSPNKHVTVVETRSDNRAITIIRQLSTWDILKDLYIYPLYCKYESQKGHTLIHMSYLNRFV